MSIYDVYPDHLLETVTEKLNRTLKGESFDFVREIKHPSNKVTYWENWFSPIRDKEGAILGVTIFSVDITDRINSEKEKTTLLTEIHHRVKNNLAIVSGLLELQKSEVNDQRLSTIFDQSINRIISIALVHELMYNNDDLSSVDVHAYLEKLVPAISATMQNRAQNVHFSLEIEEYQLNINEAIPLGLLLNELITNSFKYAFGKGENNNICVRLRSENDRIFVKYSENGRGYPDDVDFNTPKNLGLNLVHAQLTQLEAVFVAVTDYKFELEFSFTSHGKRSHSNF
jgi:two-component sensor histidine kinase